MRAMFDKSGAMQESQSDREKETWNETWRTGCKNIARGALVELLGTFVITFISCSAAVQNDTVMPVAVAYGLSVMCMMFATVGLSGGHLNPAISVALYVTRIQTFMRTLLYIIAQLGGAVAAVLVLRQTIPVAMQRMEQSAKAFHGPLGGSTSSYNLTPLQVLPLRGVPCRRGICCRRGIASNRVTCEDSS